MSEQQKDETVTFKKITLWQTATFVFLGLLVISLLTGGFGLKDLGTTPTAAAVAPSPTAPTPSAPTNIKVEIRDDDPVLGDKDSKIKIVEFSDFECPFCARAASGAVAQFKASSYFTEGVASLVYKHLPLNSIHANAQKAAEASECAREQDKFWEYHDLLFLNQRALGLDNLKAYAGQLGLNQAVFDECLDSGKMAQGVSQDATDATNAGARGTPYFVIANEDGETQVVSGAAPWSNFEAAINSLL